MSDYEIGIHYKHTGKAHAKVIQNLTVCQHRQLVPEILHPRLRQGSTIS